MAFWVNNSTENDGRRFAVGPSINPHISVS
jgi:hypothetical protein